MRLDTHFEDPQIEMAVRPGLHGVQPAAHGDGARPDGSARSTTSCRRGPTPTSTTRSFNETGLFIAGGAETTRTAIAHGLRAFADHPDQWERLADEPDLVPSAVDEVIRWVTPLNNFFRTAVEDSTIGEQAVADGDRVILLYPSANRDEAVFDDPFTFDITRRPNPHVAFGYGTHFCVGANFAKYELALLFAELTRRFTAPGRGHRARRRAQHLRPGRPLVPGPPGTPVPSRTFRQICPTGGGARWHQPGTASGQNGPVTTTVSADAPPRSATYRRSTACGPWP